MFTGQNQLRIPFSKALTTEPCQWQAQGKIICKDEVVYFKLFGMLLVIVLPVYTLESLDAVSSLQMSVQPPKQWISLFWRKTVENFTLVSMRSEFLDEWFCFYLWLLVITFGNSRDNCYVQQTYYLCCSQEFLTFSYNSVVSVHVFECTILIVGYRVYMSVGDRLELWAVLVAERVTMQQLVCFLFHQHLKA